jgi:hypothetical protein
LKNFTVVKRLEVPLKGNGDLGGLVLPVALEIPPSPFAKEVIGHVLAEFFWFAHN